MQKLYYEALCALIALIVMAFASLGAWCVFSKIDRDMGRIFPEEATITRVMAHKATVETKYGETYTCKLPDAPPFEQGEAVRADIIQGRLSHRSYCGSLRPLN